MDTSVSPKDEILFLRVCHHISNAVYNLFTRSDISSGVVRRQLIPVYVNTQKHNRTYKYNRLPEDEFSGSKHAEDIK